MLRLSAAAVILALLTAGSSLAFQALPQGTQVNDDLAAGIDKSLSVSGEDPTNADVAGGALTAGKVAVPWAAFRQGTSSGHDQAFVRSFAEGTWTTRGSGTVGGHSSASPVFAGSLNFDQTKDGEAPAIDFAGAGRTVPWASWYEDTTGAGFGTNNVFASRFDNNGDANQGKWLFGGQGRGVGGGTVPVPSLNIHTNQDAENPVIAGGSMADPTKPGPWVTWQETSTAAGNPDEIFVSKPVGPGQANCDGVTPAGVDDGTGHVPAVGGFCFQQTGVKRFGSGTLDPSLNVDPTRNGIEPDIAFTGANDSVPWVVWYEVGTGTIGGLHANEMVFAAKGIAGSGDGGLEWVAVGNARSGKLDTSETNKFGACTISSTTEGECSLNKNAAVDAEDPRVAAGTMEPARPTVPWVAWDEDVAGVKQVFVSRLVGSGAAAHFEIVNGGAPISTAANSSTRPDITFSGNTPYVSWREDVGGGIEKAFTGHFVNPAAPTFVLDGNEVPLTPHAQADVREPISSSCTATPFNADGSACQGGALGTPFFLFTNGTSPLGLFADAYQPETPTTGGASDIGSSSATIAGSVDPHGAAVTVSFQYGTTTAYGQTTAAQSSGGGDSVTPFAAQLTSLPVGTTIHYRALASSDFGTFAGGDQTLTTVAPSSPSLSSPPSGVLTATLGHGRAVAKASGTSAGVQLSCVGAATTTCRIALKLTVTETFKHHKLIAVSAKSNTKRTRKLVLVGSASATLNGGQTRLIHVALNKTGNRLLKTRHKLEVRLQAAQVGPNGVFSSISNQILTFMLPKKTRK